MEVETENLGNGGAQPGTKPEGQLTASSDRVIKRETSVKTQWWFVLCAHTALFWGREERGVDEIFVSSCPHRRIDWLFFIDFSPPHILAAEDAVPVAAGRTSVSCSLGG